MIFLLVGFAQAYGTMICCFMMMNIFPKHPGKSSFFGMLGANLSPLILGILIPVIINKQN